MSKAMEAIILAASLFWLSTCDSASILVFQTNPARSHSIVVEPLFEELAARGHHLTIVTNYPRHPPNPNITDIDMSYKITRMAINFTFDRIKEIVSKRIVVPYTLAKYDALLCEQVLSEPIIQNLFHSNTTFDLVMTEVVGCDCFVQFAHKFNAPLISFVTSSSLPWNTDRVGLPDNPSYIPNYFLEYSPSMDIFQRGFNTIFWISSKLPFNYYSIPKANSLTEKYFRVTPSTENILKNTSMVFINSYFSFSQSRPFPPNVAEIGGIHIRESTSSLPKDLQDILDSSPQGVILMSFGTLVKVSSIPRHLLLMFMNVFSTLSQTVIFKYEDDLPEAPPNVVVRKWLPQRQIIEHPNVKILLAHGGLASTIEAVYFGKPFVGVPFFADQFLNVQAVVRKGAGLMLDLNDLSEQKIHHAITEILTNPMYTKNMRGLSLQFRDRPMTPLQSAVYWTEYVIRHQGAPHLRPASVDLPLYQYLLLDVIGIIFLFLFILFYTIHVLYIRTKTIIMKIANNKYKKTD